MLKIRYNTGTRRLSGWTDIEAKFGNLVARYGEETALLDIPMPDSDDYEYFAYQDGILVSSGKPLPIPIIRPERKPEPVRDLPAEIDELKADYATLKAKVDILEKK